VSVSRRIAAGVLAGWLNAAVAVVVSLVQVRLVFRALPLELTGVWFLFLTLAGYVALFDLGIGPTLSREISFALGGAGSERETRQRVADLVGTAARFFAWISAAVVAVSVPAGLWFLSSVAPAAHLREVQVAWCVFVLGAALNVFGNAAFAGLTGLGSVGAERGVRTAVQVLYLGFLYVALASGTGMLGLSVAWVASGTVLTVAGWIALRRELPWLRDHRPVRSGILRAIAAPSAKWALTAFGSLLILDTDNVIIARVMGTAAIPSYQLVAKLAGMSVAMAGMLAVSSAPFVSVAHARGDGAAIRAIALRNLRLGMGFMAVASAWIVVFAGPFVDAWVGPGHFVGTAIVAVFVTMMFLEAHHRFHATIAMSMGHIVFHWWALGAGVLNVALTLALVRTYGLFGVALGSMVAQVLTNNWYVPAYTLRLLRMPLGSYLGAVGLPVAAVLAAALLSALAARHLLPGTAHPIVLLMAGGVAACAGGGAVSWLILLEPAERARVAAALRRLRGRAQPT
jgi:O-antigen/teichoic acid export membrane protein